MRRDANREMRREKKGRRDGELKHRWSRSSGGEQVRERRRRSIKERPANSLLNRCIFPNQLIEPAECHETYEIGRSCLESATLYSRMAKNEKWKSVVCKNSTVLTWPQCSTFKHYIVGGRKKRSGVFLGTKKEDVIKGKRALGSHS